LRSPLKRTAAAVLAASALLLSGCGDEETATDPTPDDLSDPDATVPADDDGAVGEPDDEDSQTDDQEPSADDVVPSSNRARVAGPFGGRDLNLVLTEDARCAIEEEGAGGESGAEVTGATEDGTTFSLDWSVDAGKLSASLEIEGTTWTVERDTDGTDEQVIRLTRAGEVLLDTEFESGAGESAEALLYVNCQPVT
jgi:hypothetical protein